MRRIVLIAIATAVFSQGYAQNIDSLVKKRFNLHFQQTIITQTKPGFQADYSGENSLSNKGETATSLTTTLFGGARLWKGAEAYFNPEMSGGKGFSQTLGLAGFSNGETFRVGSPQPAIYIARAYLVQTFGWGDQVDTIPDDQNQLAGYRKKRYFSITAGKFGLSDFFDGNAYSHDPRTQFLNWSLMANGAWDYPANTRGYVIGAVFELGQPDWSLRLATTMVTTTANGSIWDGNLAKAHAFTLEYEKRYQISDQKGTVRILGYDNAAKMGSYALAIAQNPLAPDVTSTRAYGRNKYGFGVNIEQSVNSDLGVFAKTSYNDGKTETWAFTEIDQSVSFGAILNGHSWNQKDAEIGLAFVGNGISKDHRDYLADGGYGFIIGDGKLNYGHEMIAEVYYKVNVYQKKVFLSPDYQFIVNPAYNKDRGPVNAFALRMHVEF